MCRNGRVHPVLAVGFHDGSVKRRSSEPGWRLIMGDQVVKDTVVGIDYRLTVADGTEVEAVEGLQRQGHARDENMVANSLCA